MQGGEQRTASATPPLGYQPALDGVRALAIVLVMLFHTDRGGHVSLVKGGFLGVDVFFVLSGFLITSLLIDEWAANGRIRLGGFWGRRVARLLPLLWALLAFMAFDRWVFHVKGVVPPSPHGFLAVLGYVGNWIPATHRDGLGKVEYLWSLSVEEQFYVLWPLLVVGLLAASTRIRRGERSSSSSTSGPLVVAIAALLGVVAVVATRANTSRETSFFFNTFLRADGLLLGATLAATRAFWWDRIRSHLSTVLTVAGGLAVAWIVYDSHVWDLDLRTWRLVALELAVVLLTMGLVTSPTALLTRVMGSKPLVWIGRRSYALYLVHVPIDDIVRAYVGEQRPRVKFIVEWPAAFVVAHLAHIAIELPAQRRIRRALRAEHVAADPAPRDIETASG